MDCHPLNPLQPFSSSNDFSPQGLPPICVFIHSNILKSNQFFVTSYFSHHLTTSGTQVACSQSGTLWWISTYWFSWRTFRKNNLWISLKLQTCSHISKLISSVKCLYFGRSGWYRQSSWLNVHFFSYFVKCLNLRLFNIKLCLLCGLWCGMDQLTREASHSEHRQNSPPRLYAWRMDAHHRL